MTTNPLHQQESDYKIAQLENEINILTQTCQEQLFEVKQKRIALQDMSNTLVVYENKINQMQNEINIFLDSRDEKIFIINQKEKTIAEQNTQIKKLKHQIEQDNIIIKRLITTNTALENTILKITPLTQLKKEIKRLLKPKLGHLNIYPASEMVVPNHYSKVKVDVHLPTISIVTPSYNQKMFLEKTILSVIHQKYTNLEYIIQDGGSCPDTVDLIKKYQHVLKHWESKEDNGQSHALNLGFQHTTGEIMGYLNSDDLLLPGALNYVGKFFKENPQVDVVYSHRVLINENDLEIGRWVLPHHNNQILSWADYIPQETLFWRRQIWDKAGGKIDESFSFAMDWDLVLRFREAGAKFVRLPRFLGAFRVHSNQKTSAEMAKNGEKEMQLLRKRCNGRDVTMHEINKKIRFYLAQSVVYHKLYRAGVLRY